MPTLKPEIAQWINQLSDKVEAVAFFAYQSLQEEVLHAGAPGRQDEQAQLAQALGGALGALKPGAGGPQAASAVGNSFLDAVATQAVPYRHPARARVHLARLLGYVPHEAAVPPLKSALDDLEARDMARCSLELHPAPAATDALVVALEAVGGTFRVGVLASLSKRGGEKAESAVRRAVDDPQPEVRLAALEALADFPNLANDAVLEKATHSADATERVTAHIARARLAECLRAHGDTAAMKRVYQAIAASDAPEPQKRAARLALA